MKLYLCIIVILNCVWGYTMIVIMPKQKKNILKFGYGINQNSIPMFWLIEQCFAIVGWKQKTYFIRIYRYMLWQTMRFGYVSYS